MGASHGVALVDHALEEGKDDGSGQESEAGSNDEGDPSGLAVGPVVSGDGLLDTLSTDLNPAQTLEIPHSPQQMSKHAQG